MSVNFGGVPVTRSNSVRLLLVVAEAKNGLEAVALTEQNHPDIVFLDIRMPGLTGIEAAREIERRFMRS